MYYGGKRNNNAKYHALPQNNNDYDNYNNNNTNYNVYQNNFNIPQQSQMNQNNGYVQQPLVAVAVAQPAPVQQQQPEAPANPFRPGIAPHYTSGGPSAPPEYNNASAPPAQASYNNNNNNNNNQTNSVNYNNNNSNNNNYNNNNNNNNNNNGAEPGQPKEAKDVAVDVAKAGGALAVRGFKAGIGALAKGLNKLDDKLNENNQPKEGQQTKEGR